MRITTLFCSSKERDSCVAKELVKNSENSGIADVLQSFAGRARDWMSLAWMPYWSKQIRMLV